jgi:hypothetical protein
MERGGAGETGGRGVGDIVAGIGECVVGVDNVAETARVGFISTGRGVEKLVAKSLFGEAVESSAAGWPAQPTSIKTSGISNLT